MKYPCLTFILLLVHVVAFATEDDVYAVSKMSPSLQTKGTAVVKRMEQVRYEIKDPGRAIYYYKYALTILNEDGDDEAGIYEYYGKFSSINYIEGNLYDAAGKKIKELKKADITDRSITGDNLAADSRIKIHHFYYKNYPYTVEYEVEVERKDLFFMPSWMPQSSNTMSVEKSSFEIIMPADYNIRYKSYNYTGEPVTTMDGRKKKMLWEVKNMYYFKDEPYTPTWREMTTYVLPAATDFEIGGFKGNMSSWNDFGKFLSGLKQNKDILPDNIKQSVHQIADKYPDARQKIAALYEFMQKNTRYISIQLGIGGWQPLEASFVAQKGYGDCKALTNYMYSLLKEAGIPSYYTVIRAGETASRIEPDFPAQQFNHVILSVPLAADTVWLECTSQTLPAGYLSGFTSNRYALMVKDDGGYLVRTPSYKMKDNVQVRTIKATLNEEGQLLASINTHYAGTQQDDLHQIIHGYPKPKQLEFLKKEMGGLGTYDVKEFDYKESKSPTPSIDEYISLVVESFAQVSGKRLFITPNLLNKNGMKLKDEERMSDIMLIFEYKDVDSVEISIPKGYTSEAVPKDVNIQSKFGNYNISFKVADDKVIMFRNFERLAGRFAKTDYKEFVKFYEDIYKADRSKIVLVKKEG